MTDELAINETTPFKRQRVQGDMGEYLLYNKFTLLVFLSNPLALELNSWCDM
jgi:hypothetical protein